VYRSCGIRLLAAVVMRKILAGCRAGAVERGWSAGRGLTVDFGWGGILDVSVRWVSLLGTLVVRRAGKSSANWYGFGEFNGRW